MTMLRQTGQIVLVVLAFWATLSVDADNGHRFLVDAARGGALSRDLLGAVALIVAGLAIGRFLLAKASPPSGGWFASHQQWLIVGALGGAALGVYCLA